MIRPRDPSPPVRRARALALLLVVGLVGAAGACTGTAEGGPAATSGADCGPVSATVETTDVTVLPDPPAPELPVTVTSADGITVTVTDVDRILPVNLYGSIAEIVFSLGLGDRVVGRDTATTFPAAAHLPLVTPTGHDLTAEGVFALAPTVVLVDASVGPPEVLEQLRRADIAVVFVDDTRSLAAVPEQIRAIAAALGVPAAGEHLVERVESEIAAARAAAPPQDPPLRIAFLYLRGTAGVYLIAGEGSGADSMIEAIGAEDAGTAIGMVNFRPLTSEGLINAAPDVILVMSDGLASVGGVDGLLEIPGVAQTPAGEQRRIVDLPDGVLLNFGSRSGEAVASLAAAVEATCR